MDNPIAEAYVQMLRERNEKKKAGSHKMPDGSMMKDDDPSMKETKLDPVGKADADIDNDGDTDSSDEYLHKRRKAIKKSMKTEEADELDEKGPKVKKTLAQVSVKGISKRANNMARTGKTEETVDEVRQLKDPKKEVMVVDKNGKNMVIDKSKQDAFLAKGWKLSESVEETYIASAKKKTKLSLDDINKALRSGKNKAKSKDSVTLSKTPWDKYGKKEAVEIETDDDKTDAEDPKVQKKKGPEKKKVNDPAATNAPSQDDRQTAADAPDPSPDPDAEPTPPKEKEAPAPKKDKIAVKKKPDNDEKEEVKEAKSNPIEFMDDDKSAISGLAKKAGVKANFIKGNHHSHDGRVEYVGSSANIKKALIAHHGDKETAAEEHPKMFKESFNWDEISEMTDDQVDAMIDTLDEAQLDQFESEMNEASNVDGDADQENKAQIDFIAKHKGPTIDRPDADKPKDGTKASPKRPGDKADGDKAVVKPLKSMKDVRK